MNEEVIGMKESAYELLLDTGMSERDAKEKMYEFVGVFLDERTLGKWLVDDRDAPDWLLPYLDYEAIAEDELDKDAYYILVNDEHEFFVWDK